MMDRLTEKDPYWMGEEFWLSAREPDVEEIDKVYEKLKHYEDLAEAGRLVELPCAVGDTVYIVQYEDCNNGKCPWFNDKLGCSKGGIGSEYCPQEVIEFEFELEDLGRKIYLTREEAEAALKEREAE